MGYILCALSGGNNVLQELLSVICVRNEFHVDTDLKRITPHRVHGGAYMSGCLHTLKPDQRNQNRRLKTGQGRKLWYCNSVVFLPKHVTDISLLPEEVVSTF